VGIYSLLIAGNIAAWVWALLAFREQPILLGTALLSDESGLR
jgi:high-affinity nickel-transport protein